MVAYNFKHQFVEPILAGTKRQTIRAERKGRSRHAAPGEMMQLYFGLRTKHARIIGEARCIEAYPIEIDFARSKITEHWDIVARETRNRGRLNRFAQADGFTDWNAMRAFWRKTHPGLDLFKGVLLRWEPVTNG